MEHAMQPELDRTNMDERGKASWEARYHLERSTVLWSHPPVPFVETEVVRRIRENGLQTVLDVPCGDGRNTIPLAHAASYVVAADSSPSALTLAAARVREHGLRNVTFAEVDVFATAWPDARFDAILCWDLLGHLIRPTEAIGELLRILRPGGVLVGSVFATGDSTRGLEMRHIGPGSEEFIYRETFYFKFYDRVDALDLARQVPGCELLDLSLARWTEPPHEGYREYEHEHESWAFTFRRT
jgi:SAM-dependent methyltransferase